jgi:hypothetical protein
VALAAQIQEQKALQEREMQISEEAASNQGPTPSSDGTASSEDAPSQS